MTVLLSGANAPEKILVKFFTKRRELIPHEIPKTERGSDVFYDRVHETVGRDVLGLSTDEVAVGRVREGRVDTGGEPVIQSGSVEASALRRGLANAGFRLTNAHYFERSKPDGVQYVVNLGFELLGENADPAVLSRLSEEGFRALARMSWSQLFVYSNPNGVMTANFSGPQHDHRAKRTLAVREGELTIVDNK